MKNLFIKIYSSLPVRIIEIITLIVVGITIFWKPEVYPIWAIRITGLIWFLEGANKFMLLFIKDEEE